MATFLETLGILDYFTPIFASLLAIAVVYALLSKTKILGDSKTLQLVVAFVFGILILSFPDIVNMITTMAPLFLVVFIFAILLLLVYMVFGISEGDITTYIKGDRSIGIAIFAIGLLVVIGTVFSIFGQRALQATDTGTTGTNNVTTGGTEGGDEFGSNLFSTLFSPKILGLLVIFAIAFFAVIFLGGQVSA